MNSATLELIGKTGTIHMGAMAVYVKILDAKTAYGVERVLVTPVAGEGSQWVNLTKVSDIQ